jgi:predicted DNA-binding transcriptional regulator YafY
VLAFAYTREDGQSSEREVRPLALYFWSGVWTLAAWCELRKDFRTFRIDRMQDVRVLGREFVQKKGQRLEDYLRQVTKQSPVGALPKRA